MLVLRKILKSSIINFIESFKWLKAFKFVNVTKYHSKPLNC